MSDFTERFTDITDFIKKRTQIPFHEWKERLGIDISTPSLMNYRSGKSLPGCEALKELRLKTGIDLNYLICGNETLSNNLFDQNELEKNKSDPSALLKKNNKENQQEILKDKLQQIEGIFSDPLRGGKITRFFSNEYTLPPINTAGYVIWTEATKFMHDGWWYMVSFYDTTDIVPRLIYRANNGYNISIISGAVLEPKFIREEDIRFHGYVNTFIKQANPF